MTTLVSPLCSLLLYRLRKTRTHEDKERAPMAASVTLPPPGPAREFYCRVSPGRPPPDTPTDRAHRKKFGAPHCSDPCSPLLATARHCRLGCRGCRAPARYATTNCTSWARTNDQNVPDPNAAPTRPHRRLDMQYAQNWPLIKHYSFAEATRRPSTASLPSYRATRSPAAASRLPRCPRLPPHRPRSSLTSSASRNTHLTGTDQAQEKGAGPESKGPPRRAEEL